MLKNAFVFIYKDDKFLIKFHKINIDTFPDIALQHHVMSVPTLILFKNSNELWRMRGFETAGKLSKKW